MTGFGVTPWGTGSFGIAADLVIEYAYAISTHEVVVVLNKPPKDVFHLLDGDVRNANSWRVSIQSPLQYFQVAECRPYNAPLEWVVRTVQFLPDSTGIARVEAVGLLDANNAAMGEPSFSDFAGVTEKATSTPTELAVTRGSGSRDIANNPAPTLGGGAEGNLSGTLIIKAGDYALVDGAALLRKLIIRRLTTTPGDFFHLPNYGVGLKVKQPIPSGNLVRFRSLVERELLLEPDLGQVTVGITQSSNTLTIQVRAVLVKTGQQVSVGLFSPIG
jgi:hypothetical protein